MRETEINLNTCTHLKRICLFMQIKAKSEAIILDNVTQLQHHRPLMDFAHWLSDPFFSYSLGILSELYPALFVVYQSIIIL
jgi:hypothetical protein